MVGGGKAIIVGKQFKLLRGMGQALFFLLQPGFAAKEQTATMAFAQGGAFLLVAVAVPAFALRQTAITHAADLLTAKAADILARVGNGKIFQLFHGWRQLAMMAGRFFTGGG